MVYQPDRVFDDDPDDFDYAPPRTRRLGALIVAGIAAAALGLGALAGARAESLTERSQGALVIPVDAQAQLAAKWPAGGWFPAASSTSGSFLSPDTAHAAPPPSQTGADASIPTATPPTSQPQATRAPEATPSPTATRSTDLRAASASTATPVASPSTTPTQSSRTAASATPTPAGAAPSPTSPAGTPTPLPTSIAYFTPTPTPRGGIPTATPTATPTPAPRRQVSGDRMAEWERELFALHNEERADAGVAPLALNQGLTEVARERARDMAERNYFAHVSPTGEDAFTLLKAHGITYWSAGENIAMNTYPADNTVMTAMTGFMESPPHRENLLDPDYELVGVGVAVDGDKKYYAVIFTGFSLP